MNPPKILLTEQYMRRDGTILRNEQLCAVDRIDFKKRTMSFLFLNKNKRWQRQSCELNVDKLFNFGYD